MLYLYCKFYKKDKKDIKTEIITYLLRSGSVIFQVQTFEYNIIYLIIDFI